MKRLAFSFFAAWVITACVAGSAADPESAQAVSFGSPPFAFGFGQGCGVSHRAVVLTNPVCPNH